jgi:hypothetical protein
MFNINKNLETKEYLIEEEDCIIAHGLVDSRSILNSKQNLIERIQNYQYTFIESQTISMHTDKKINVFYSADRNISRLLIERLFRIEKTTI